MMGQESEILKALLDLRIALGELQQAMADVGEAIQRLMQVELQVWESKNNKEQ